jgi:hypothetical protein
MNPESLQATSAFFGSDRWIVGRCAFPDIQKRGCQVPGHGLHFVSRHPLQFSDAGMKINSAGEAEAASAGEQPAEE